MIKIPITEFEGKQFAKMIWDNNFKFPRDPVEFKMAFSDDYITDHFIFSVIENTILLNKYNGYRIDFLFKQYTPHTDVQEEKKMILEVLNDFVPKMIFTNEYLVQHNNMIRCIDRILKNLGYTGKKILATGFEITESGQLFLFSESYAVDIITPPDWAVIGL